MYLYVINSLLLEQTEMLYYKINNLILTINYFIEKQRLNTFLRIKFAFTKLKFF
jgi:hypothetical protein